MFPLLTINTLRIFAYLIQFVLKECSKNHATHCIVSSAIMGAKITKQVKIVKREKSDKGCAKNSTAENYWALEVLSNEWNRFKLRCVNGEATLQDIGITVVSFAMAAYAWFKIRVWLSTSTEVEPDKWMERAVACESKYQSALIATFFASCCLWLVYLLHLTERHCGDVIQLIIEKLEAENKRNLAIAQVKHKEEIIKMLKEAQTKTENELQRLKNEMQKREVRQPEGFENKLNCLPLLL